MIRSSLFYWIHLAVSAVLSLFSYLTLIWLITGNSSWVVAEELSSAIYGGGFADFPNVLISKLAASIEQFPFISLILVLAFLGAGVMSLLSHRKGKTKESHLWLFLLEWARRCERSPTA
jgi:hypothetical protein